MDDDSGRQILVADPQQNASYLRNAVHPYDSPVSSLRQNGARAVVLGDALAHDVVLGVGRCQDGLVGRADPDAAASEAGQREIALALALLQYW